MEAETTQAGTVESRAKAERDPRAVVAFWRQQIALADKEEADWRKSAQDAVDIYADAKRRDGAKRQRYFNILYANTETIVPSLYNSTPIPDVRRRFGDPDPVARVAAQALERGLTYSTDIYDFDFIMRGAVQDMVLPGRGVARVRYEPVVEGDSVPYESVRCELVHWRDFRRGPARVWDDVPWVAFRHWMSRDEVMRLNPRIGATLPLQATVDDRDKQDAKRESDVLGRAPVWEVWDKEKREVLFVADGHEEAPLLIEPDPLELEGFFPVPRPLYDVDVTATGSLVPVESYRLYRDQAEELDAVTRRISAIVKVMKVRGFYLPQMGDLSLLENMGDGEFKPAADGAEAAALLGGGIDKAVWMLPLDTLIKVLEGLYLNRDQIKQTIYEITGLSDIIRGSTDAGETARAQSIKAQWGSLRIERRKAEVARFARDLFRLKAELMAQRFQPQMLEMMTGIKLPTAQDKAMMQMAAQAGQPVPPEQMEMPTWDDVMQVLRSDAMRGFRVDIETDSTVQADVARQQQNIGEFLNGFSLFVQAIGPAVQAGAFPAEAAGKLLVAFARPFKLGRQAEDALEQITQPAPAQGPTPAEVQIQEKENAARSKEADAKVMVADANVRKAQVEGQNTIMQMQAQAMMPQPFQMAPGAPQQPTVQ